MDILTDLMTHTMVLRRLVGDDCAAVTVPVRMASLNDECVVDVIREASAVITAAESLRVAAAGVAAARSRRERGHGGLSQSRGHGSAVSLVQAVGGTTRADAIKQVRVGEALMAGLGVDGMGADDGGGAGTTDVPRDVYADTGTDMGTGADVTGTGMGADVTGTVTGTCADVTGGGNGSDGDATAGQTAPTASNRGEVWHAPLDRALLSGTLTAAQHDAILRGLGTPDDVDVSAADADDDACTAWRAAAAQLVDEAAQRSVEELGAAARLIRDRLDPEGAQRRFDERFERRSFRTWTDADGVQHGSFIFDDDAAVWVRTILDAALRPRRGVRFIDPAEQARAQQLADDPRTTPQLSHDLMIDVLRAGALASHTDVFGTRQAGVRLLITQQAAQDNTRGGASIGCTEDDSRPLPAWLVATHACDVGTSACIMDGNGNPLDVGRDSRLFLARQKIALAVRDGGCRWPGCDRPASYCEAHHIDPWAEGGSTDVDRGILLCRFHHMQLHHRRWWITRHGRENFALHPPGGGAEIVLTPRTARRYLWTTSPPLPRFRPAERVTTHESAIALNPDDTASTTTHRR